MSEVQLLLYRHQCPNNVRLETSSPKGNSITAARKIVLESRNNLVGKYLRMNYETNRDLRNNRDPLAVMVESFLNRKRWQERFDDPNRSPKASCHLSMSHLHGG